MPSQKLTKATVSRLEPATKAFLVWDADLTGLGIKVMPSGVMSWVLRYRTEQGKQRMMKLGDAAVIPPSDARNAATRHLGEVAKGGDPLEARQRARKAVVEERAAAVTTFEAVAQRYIDEHVLPKRAASTANEYIRKLEVDFPTAFKKQPIADVTRDSIEDLHQAKKRSPVSANRTLAFISSVLSFAEKRGLRPLNSNLAQLVEKYPERPRDRFLTEAELKKFGAALSKLEKQEPKLACACDAIRLVALTGARRNEVLHLRWEYIDEEAGVAWLPTSKTGQKPLRLGAAGMALLDGRPRNSVWCFPSYVKPGTPLNDVRKTLLRAIKLAKIKPFRLHDLRHSFASVAVKAGYSLPVTGAMLGHSRASTTERYAHLQRDHVHEAVEGVQGHIARALEDEGNRED